MASKRKIVKTVTSGFPSYVREVDIYDSTYQHVQENHPTEYETLGFGVFEAAIEGNATRIHKSKTRKDSIVLVNDKVKSRRGDPLRVPVKVFSDGTGIMSTAGYSSSNDQGELLWSESEGALQSDFATDRPRTGRDDER